MNPKSSPLGSIWRKWDLHFHTPASYDCEYKGATNQEIIDKLIDAGIEVVAITDHHRIDAARILELQKLGGTRLTVLPGIELRSELGGSESVHFIGIFPEDSNIKDLWTKLSGKLDITEADVAKRGDDTIYCPFVKSAEVIRELGGLISVHAGKKTNSIENLKNSEYIKQIVKKDLVRDYIDIYEVGAVADIADYVEKVFPHLDRPIPLIICSDNHDIRDYKTKCPLWIKGDKTFEALRQTLFEHGSRVHVAEVPPIEPVLQIRKAKITFSSDTSLKSTERSDAFCFRGTREIVFSPYLTCIIGGRGTGKSTLLNLIHEAIDPGVTEFFRKNKLSPEEVSVAANVTIEGISGKGVVEFLQQNEIEHFASDHKRLTGAIFARLRKLDANNLLQSKDEAVGTAITATKKQLDRLKNHHNLSIKLNDSEKELATQKGVVESFQNADYKRINGELALLNKEFQGLKTSKGRLEKLVQDLKALLADYPAYDPSLESNLNAYEQQVRTLVEAIENGIASAIAHTSLQAAATREQSLAAKMKELRDELAKFLKARGLSEENLADVGKATEKIAQLDEEIASLKKKVGVLQTELGQFAAQRHTAEEYVKAVEELLAPINVALKGQGAEVKPIELGYRFDRKAFKEAMVQYVAGAIGQVEGRAPRPDYVVSKLGKLDFTALGDHEAALKQIPDEDGIYARTLREFISQDVNFEALKLEAELRLLDVQKFGHIFVLYDGKPIENSSFGQRCTAVLVVLLLLGNMPVVIDEPEAHLDSSLIAKYLVDLIKNRKIHRQIIFATHNANLVINGDAELVHCMSMDDTKVTNVVSTTIENLEHRELLLALEGGEKAFHQREKRYGID